MSSIEDSQLLDKSIKISFSWDVTPRIQTKLRQVAQDRHIKTENLRPHTGQVFDFCDFFYFSDFSRSVDFRLMHAYQKIKSPFER
jgi:hypothetical protein